MDAPVGIVGLVVIGVIVCVVYVNWPLQRDAPTDRPAIDDFANQRALLRPTDSAPHYLTVGTFSQGDTSSSARRPEIWGSSKYYFSSQAIPLLILYSLPTIQQIACHLLTGNYVWRSCDSRWQRADDIGLEVPDILSVFIAPPAFLISIIWCAPGFLICLWASRRLRVGRNLSGIAYWSGAWALTLVLPLAAKVTVNLAQGLAANGWGSWNSNLGPPVGHFFITLAFVGLLYGACYCLLTWRKTPAAAAGT